MRVREENQTLATITLQNYFRMYDKLAGMSGTALTEATEFMKIYKVGVVEIPTNRPMVRKDQNDQIYKTKEGKWRAVAREIQERHDKGQPVLVGTISVEVSELLSERLRKMRRPAHGAQRQARARRARGRDHRRGRRARRGHDRHQHGRPRRRHQARRQRRAPRRELELDQARPAARRPGLRRALRATSCPKIEARVEDDREVVLEAGGLFICGTERHESRRIDNQLRGRAGRQGDPGESRFFLSAEDDLVRLFAGDRIYRILDRLGPKADDGEEEPIEAKMLSKQIESAQRKVEEQNFLIRKRVLEYDDVMNQQREVVYQYRDEVLEGRDMGRRSRASRSPRSSAAWSTSTRPATSSRTGTSTSCGSSSTRSTTSTSAPTRSTARRSTATSSSGCSSRTRSTLYDEREEELGEELMRALERYLLLQIIDQRWREHLYDMDYLREGIHLRGFAQIEPLVAYKNEAFTLFEDLMNTIWSDFARMIYNVEVEVAGPERRRRRRRRRRSGPRRSSRRLRRARSTPAARSRTSRAPTAATARPRRRASRAAGRGSSAASTSTSRSAATTRAGAARARSSRSATAPERAACGCRGWRTGSVARARPEARGA